MSLEKEIKTKLEIIENEIKKLHAITLMANWDSIEDGLAKICTTIERKKMWIYLDGTKTHDEIAKLVGKTRSAVSVFVNHAKEFSLIENFKGRDKRVINIIPSSWNKLIKK